MHNGASEKQQPQNIALRKCKFSENRHHVDIADGEPSRHCVGITSDRPLSATSVSGLITSSSRFSLVAQVSSISFTNVLPLLYGMFAARGNFKALATDNGLSFSGPQLCKVLDVPRCNSYEVNSIVTSTNGKAELFMSTFKKAITRYTDFKIANNQVLC